MYILGFGKAFPNHTLGDGRFTSLPIPYINETKNIPIKNALMHAVSSPSKIGEIALKNALENSKISKEELEYIIGDTATPWETCPSEAQRITGRLGLKIPAYDVIGIGCALSTALFSFTRWNEVPPLIGWVSTNLLTQVIDFRDDLEKKIFGDGAGACVLSPFKERGFRVELAHYTTNHLSRFVVEEDLFGSLKIKNLPTSDELRKEFEPFLPKFDGIVVVPPILEDLIKPWIEKEVVTHRYGELLGSNSCITLSEVNVPVGSNILVLEKSGGGGTGVILLKRVS